MPTGSLAKKNRGLAKSTKGATSGLLAGARSGRKTAQLTRGSAALANINGGLKGKVRKDAPQATERTTPGTRYYGT